MRSSLPSPRALLGLPSNRAVLILAASGARECRSSLRRTLRSPTPRTLHRFRVALRRLRTHLKFYSDFAVDRKKLETLRCRLSDCADATSRLRDIHVAEALIRGTNEAGLAERRAPLAELRSRRRNAERKLLSVLRSEAHWFGDELETELSKLFPLFVSHPIPFENTLRRLEKRSTARVIRSIEKVRPKQLVSKRYEAEVHELRLRSKRLRYLIAPFETTSSVVASKVAALKRIQDWLGKVRDLRLALHFLTRGSMRESPQIKRALSKRLELALVGAKAIRRTSLLKALSPRSIPASLGSPAQPLSSPLTTTGYLRDIPSASQPGVSGRNRFVAEPPASATRQKQRFPIVSAG